MKKLAMSLLVASIMINTTNILSVNAASPAGLKGRDAPLSTHDRPRYTRNQRKEIDIFNIRENNIDGEDIKWDLNYIDKDVYNTILGQMTEFISQIDIQPTIKFKPGFIQEIPDGLIDDRISGSYNIDIPDTMLERFIIEAPDFDDNIYNNDFGHKDLLKNSDILDQKTDEEKIPKRGSLPGNSHDALLSKSSKSSKKEYNDLNSLISDSVDYNNLIVGDQYKVEVIYTASFWEPIDSESKLSDNIETKSKNGKLYKLVKINFGKDGIVYSDYFTPQKKNGNYELTYVINPDFLDRIMEIAEKYDVENIQSDIYILKTK